MNFFRVLSDLLECGLLAFVIFSALSVRVGQSFVPAVYSAHNFMHVSQSR